MQLIEKCMRLSGLRFMHAVTISVGAVSAAGTHTTWLQAGHQAQHYGG
jgi:hypothetical protein